MRRYLTKLNPNTLVHIILRKDDDEDDDDEEEEEEEDGGYKVLRCRADIIGAK